jgi:hypothetical protein
MRIYQPWRYSIYHRDIKNLREERMRHVETPGIYQYRPLESDRHIRLLQLLKRRSSMVPRCELLHFELDTDPPYSAPPYTWGRQAASIPLAVGENRLLVTSAVEEFLTCEGSKFTSKFFWIDAICIDQKNDDEKAAQIPLMTEIYQSAISSLCGSLHRKSGKIPL